MNSSDFSKERIKKIKNLHEHKERVESELFIIEGMRLMDEALKEMVPIEEVLYTAKLAETSRGGLLLASMSKMHLSVSQVTEKAMKAIAETENPQGILAVARQLKWTFKDLIKNKGTIIIACGLQDPGNLGTIIRSADAGGCGGVFTTQNSVDIYNSKVIRATMGSIFRLPVMKFDDPIEAVSALKEEGYQVIATTAHSRISYLDPDYMKPTAFLIGQEGAGLSEEVLESADKRVFIHMKKGVESLNAAVSASILIYEAFRQRMMQRL
jgi:TrmH family RNA methyltransferase